MKKAKKGEKKRRKGELVAPELKTKTVKAALCLSHLDQGFSNIFMSRTPKWTHLAQRGSLLIGFCPWGVQYSFCCCRY